MCPLPSKSLHTENYYVEHEKILVAVDCIVFGFQENALKILLLERDFEPGKGQLSLIGGFVRSNEDLDAAAARILYELTGLEKVFLEQLYTYGDPDRDPGERVISVSYYALLKVQELDEDYVRDHGASWHVIGDCDQLIFDHASMCRKALKRLQRRAKSRPIGFELLPPEFSIPQLQSLYEAIEGRKLDGRNFRKKLLGMDVLEHLDIKDKSGSKKGAFLYRFDEQRYQSLLKEGFLFDLG